MPTVLTDRRLRSGSRPGGLVSTMLRWRSGSVSACRQADTGPLTSRLAFELGKHTKKGNFMHQSLAYLGPAVSGNIRSE